MSAVLMHSQEGTPLHLIEKEHYANWLDSQPEHVKQW